MNPSMVQGVGELVAAGLVSGVCREPHVLGALCQCGSKGTQQAERKAVLGPSACPRRILAVLPGEGGCNTSRDSPSRRGPSSFQHLWDKGTLVFLGFLFPALAQALSAHGPPPWAEDSSVPSITHSQQWSIFLAHFPAVASALQGQHQAPACQACRW